MGEDPPRFLAILNVPLHLVEIGYIIGKENNILIVYSSYNSVRQTKIINCPLLSNIIHLRSLHPLGHTVSPRGYNRV